MSSNGGAEGCSSRNAIQVVSPEGTFVSPVSFVAVKIRVVGSASRGEFVSDDGVGGREDREEEVKEVER